MKMKRFFKSLNEGHELKDKVCHKILFKVIIIIIIINGKIFKIPILVEIIVDRARLVATSVRLATTSAGLGATSKFEYPI